MPRIMDATPAQVSMVGTPGRATFIGSGGGVQFQPEVAARSSSVADPWWREVQRATT